MAPEEVQSEWEAPEGPRLRQDSADQFEEEKPFLPALDWMLLEVSDPESGHSQPVTSSVTGILS